MLLIDQLNRSPADSFEVLHEHMYGSPRKYPGAIYKMGRIPTSEYRDFESFLTEIENNPLYAETLLDELLCSYIGKVPLSELVPLLTFKHEELLANIEQSRTKAKKFSYKEEDLNERRPYSVVDVLSEPFSDYHEIAALTLIRHLILTSKREVTVKELFNRSDAQRFGDLIEHFLQVQLKAKKLTRPTFKMLVEAKRLAAEEMEKDHQELLRVSKGRIPREMQLPDSSVTQNLAEPTASALPAYQML